MRQIDLTMSSETVRRMLKKMISSLTPGNVVHWDAD